MNKNKEAAKLKDETKPHQKIKKPKSAPSEKGNDYGGIPDIDPKKFLGCG